jgi:hypothetical protein
MTVMGISKSISLLGALMQRAGVYVPRPRLRPVLSTNKQTRLQGLEQARM